MPKSFTLYSALTELTTDHCPVFAFPSDKIIFVRAVANDFDHNEAMDRVRPMDGENFLNCVPA